MQDIEFFGGIDRKEGKPDSYITSEYPAWMFDRPVEDLQEEIARMEREINRGAIPPEQIARNKELLKSRKAKLELIQEQRPKLNDVTKDEFYKHYKELSKGIQDSMFTRSEMMLGTANAHEEAARMITPSILISPEIAKMCNLKTVDGKISRNEAQRAWKMLGKTLGEPTNAEVLRRDGTTVRTGGRPPKK